MKMIKKMLVVIFIFTFAIANAQIYTPSQTIQGSSGNNGVSIGTNTLPITMLDIKGNTYYTSMNWKLGIRLMPDLAINHGAAIIWDKGSAPYNFFMAGPAGFPNGDFFSGFSLSYAATMANPPIYTQQIFAQERNSNPIGTYRFFKNIIVNDPEVADKNKVGIGVETPTEQLHVKLGVRFEGMTNNDALTKILVQDQTGKLFWRNASSLNSVTVDCQHDNMNFLTKSNSTNGLTCSQIYDNGTFVGIGTTTAVPNFLLNVNGNIRCTGITTIGGDDAKDIVKTNGSLNKILKLEPISFKMNTNGQSGLNFDSNTHYGISIKQLEENIPDVVYTSKDLSKSINYIELIPILINAIQEQNQVINDLKSQISELEQKVDNPTLNINSGNNYINECKLYQNSPNPFNQVTEIKFDLSEKVISATLFIYNMNGNQIKQYQIDKRGENSVIIKSNELNSGMYLYTLIADGKEINTKRMIITE